MNKRRYRISYLPAKTYRDTATIKGLRTSFTKLIYPDATKGSVPDFA